MKLFYGLLLFLPAAHAGEWKSKGEITMESRAFSDDDNEVTQDTGLGLFSRLEASYKQDGWRIKVRGFSRIDHEDENRDISAIEEAWLGYKKGPWQIRLGAQMLNWTATEAFHPADVINSRNLDSNIENADKLGELMLSIRYRIRDGGLTLYYMPRAEEPELPGETSRLSFLPPGTSWGETLWLRDEDDLGHDSWTPQWGARFTQTIGDADLSLHVLDRMDRTQPLVGVVLDGSGEARAIPVYLRQRDYGLTYLHVIGGFIFKLEAAHKDFIDHDFTNFFNLTPTVSQQPDHSQVAFGTEYGIVHSSGSETTLLFEGQGMFGVDEQERAALGIFQRDLLLGMRHAFNDRMGRELLLTAIGDIERSHEYLFNLSYSQRLSDVWSIKLGARYTDAPQKNEIARGLELLDESNQLFFNLSRFF